MLEGLQKRIYTLCLVLFCALCLAVIPAVGYADDSGGGGGSHNFGGSYPNFGTVWFDKQAISNGLDVSPTRIRYGVVAFTNWDAGFYCLRGGMSFDDLSATKKRKLLADSDFYDFANLFSVGKPAATDDWSGDAAVTLAWNSARELYGETYCYSGIYTLDQWYAADAVVTRIMNESDDGGTGGGSAGEDTSYVYFDTQPNVVDGEQLTEEEYYYSGLAIKPSTYQTIQTFMDSHPDFALWISIGGYGGSGRNSFNIRCLTMEPDYIKDDNGEWSSYYWTLGGQTTRLTEVQNASSVDYNGKHYLVMNQSFPTDTFTTTNKVLVGLRPVLSYYYSGDGGSVDTEPPTVWPNPPTTPKDPPPVPDPPTPTPPTPWNPIPDIGIEITGEDFQDLIDALDEHCKHLQKAIQDNISQLWDLQSDLISNEFADLKDYLNDLFSWLAERMNFNVNYTNGQYDDTSVITWLKKIWSKMGDGINTQPTDPVQEPDDWWAWLLALMSNFVAMLLSFGSDRLGDVMNGLSSLTGKFPFSLPWDLLALLAMLDAPPQIPEWDLPCYAVSLEGLEQVSTYHISLEQYDTVWENVRWIERLSFIVLLVRSTDLFTGMMRRAVGSHD